MRFDLPLCVLLQRGMDVSIPSVDDTPRSQLPLPTAVAPVPMSPAFTTGLVHPHPSMASTGAALSTTSDGVGDEEEELSPLGRNGMALLVAASAADAWQVCRSTVEVGA